MTHPEELLADYVDDALDEGRRVVVETHLAGCATCREEIELARRARAALAELQDRPVPFGVTGPVIAEAGRRFEGRRGAAWDRLQWAAGLAAAAAIVVVVALNVGGEDGAPTTARSEATGAAAGGGVPEAADAQAAPGDLGFRGLERQAGVSYDEAGVEGLAGETASALSSAASLSAGASTEDRRSATGGPFAASGDAEACIARSGGPVDGPRDALVRLIQAEFEGTPAYLAVFAQSPGAGQAADHVVVWVAATADCRILHTASLRI